MTRDLAAIRTRAIQSACSQNQTVTAALASKRHEMGPRLAESIVNPVPGTSFVVPTSVFLTTELWGLGSSAPYLHDGRATTIEEAIIEHGGEAQASRDRFRALDNANQDDVLAFLNNLVLFFPAEEE